MYAEFHPEADQELAGHALFYEQRESGLGSRFIGEIEAALAVLISQPRIGQVFQEEFRCLVLGEFPFTLIYRVELDRIWIVAVAHHSRRPGYWQGRIHG